MKEIKGGVTAPQGFRANGVHAGVKAGSDPAKNDLALIFSEKECTAAATYTLNRVKAAMSMPSAPAPPPPRSPA